MKRVHLQRGASLIEVLVAVVILAVGLLGVAGMQMSALRSNQSAYERSVATFLASSIAERMSANRAAALAGQYNLGMGSGSCPVPAGGTLAQEDMRSWITELQDTGMLGPHGCGSVACNAGLCVITVRWQDDRAAVAGGETPQIVVEVRL